MIKSVDYFVLKLDLYDKNNLQTKHKNLVWNQYTLFDSSLFSHSDCESSPVKMYMYVNKRTLLEGKPDYSFSFVTFWSFLLLVFAW